MKRITQSLVAVGVVLLIFVVALIASRAPQTHSSGKHQARSLPTLTQAEERGLDELIPQALTWAVTWVPEPTSCPLGVPEQETLDLTELYKRYEGQEVEMRLDITENNLKVYLVPLQTSLSFARLHNLGLSPPRLDFFCEDVPEEVKKHHQVRSYLVAPVVKQPAQSEATWNIEKKRLYEQVLEVIQREACFSVSHAPGKSIKVTVPDFNVGDPEIYVLFEGPPSQFDNGITIEWINFRRNPSSGDHTAEHMKNFGLPDETRRFAEVIRRKRVRETEVECSKKLFEKLTVRQADRVSFGYA